MTKDIKYPKELKWDTSVIKTPEEAAQEIFDHAVKFSHESREWYWKSIKSKKRASLTIRIVVFTLLIFGAILPLLAGLLDDPLPRLRCTQFGVAALAVAGLFQLGDRVFGLSSGWLRYITTVTAMEDLTRRFESDWKDYMFSKSGKISEVDVKPLFDLAKKFEDDISAKRIDETDKWVTEFTTSTALLNEMIKSQREAAEKSVTEEKEKQKAQVPGAIELSIVPKGDPVEVMISLDEGKEETFTGLKWSMLGISTGIHKVKLSTTGKKPLIHENAVNVPAGEVAKIEIKL
jgi:hypothetical protein